MATIQTLKVALVGCGGLGARHAKNVAGMEGADLVAVCDMFPESARRLAAELGPAPAPYGDHREMLDAARPDAVLVVTPNDTHSRVAIDAASSGAHVFCEKPMALTVGDCDAMIRAAGDAGVVLMIGYVRRFQAAYREMKRRVDAGDVGEVRLAHTLRLGAGPPGGVEGWQFKKDRYGGLFSIYSHELDQLAWLAGEISSVQAVMQYGEDPENEIEEGIFIGMEFASGAVGSLGCSRVHPVSSYELGVAGTGGTLKLSAPGGPVVYGRRGEEAAQIEVPRNNGLAEEVAHFFDCIRQGRRPDADGTDGRRVVAVALAAHESARTGRKVEVGPAA